ncbi:MAG: extracellular solute-binding protein, partial [Oscillospiraceae bacterium]|nr:extracellular solute-binding protein [Oscillospiraceae bacterium]
MKKRKILALCLVLVLCLTAMTGCGAVRTTGESGTADTSPATETTSDGAGTEPAEETSTGIEKATTGSLTVYTAFEDDQIDKYLASFYEQYPDIELEVIRESTGTLIAKVIAEKDNPVADVIWGTSASVLLQLEPYGLIKGYSPDGIEALDSKFCDSENEEALWTGCDVYETAFCVNTELCEEAGVPIPDSFEDLLNPCYQGMIIMPDPTSSGTGMLTVNGILQIMGEEAGWDYLNKLNENIAYYTTSGSKPAKMAAAGECAIGISFGYRCATLLADGNPVEVVFPTEGCGWDVEANCLINKEEINPA